jgi:hypothetical protein
MRLSGPDWPRLAPSTAHAYSGPGGPPRPADARCIYTSDSRQKYKPNNQIKFVYINAQFFILSARDRSLLNAFDTVIRKSPPRKQHLRDLPAIIPRRSSNNGLQGR